MSIVALRTFLVKRARISASFIAILILSAAGTVQAQSHVRIGNSVSALIGPWRFHAGDNSDWAQPGLNDAGWSTMNLSPPPGSFDPNLGTGGFVPGWTSQGYPNLTGFGWYRLTFDVVNNAATPEESRLAIKMPDNVDDAYQVYVNGRFAGQFGDFTKSGVTFYNTQPRAFLLPDNLHEGPITIAVRMWMDSSTPLGTSDAGGLHGAPLIGQRPSIGAMLRLDWDDVARSQAGNFLESAFLLVAAFAGFALFWLDRHDLAYLWLGIACSVSVLLRLVVLMGYYTMWISMARELIATDVVLAELGMGAWTLFWGYWFKFDRMRALHLMTWAFVLLSMLNMALLRPPFYGTLIPLGASSWLMPLSIISRLTLGALMLWVTFNGIRRRGLDGWLSLPAVLLMIPGLYQTELVLLHIQTFVRFFGIILNLSQISILLQLAMVSLLLSRRFIKGLRAGEQMRVEIEQARQVQQLLIPEALPRVPGLSIESEYRPAQQVGGDFFQIVPDAEGGVLAVIGDVSGKGMPAAMTVSKLVGAVRTLAETTRDPAEVLRGLNRRMIGRQSGQFATCLAAYIAPGGDVTLSSAGHLPPYRNGQELSLAGSVPLGIVAEADFESISFRLDPGSSLVMLTDGVVEAHDGKGQLFGFERTLELVSEGRDAEELATAAQNFGQQDDITVLRFERTEGAAKAAEPSLDVAELSHA
jgi:hypothetical protein